ncbi:glycoside hydrolase family 88 protein [Actinocrispum sp. NPDC049592]|uniref:glycoside hydrolase family 88/105 protein n=1 Tax=Actinocrispum sp. NPDC049592 TaxID=3154835 RepID=UPI0034219004
MPTRRSVLLGTAGAALALPVTAGRALAATDWSVEVVRSTMARFTPATLGGWDYMRGLYLYGQYLVYKRTGTRAYFDYIKAWVDRFVDGNGNINNSFNNLDAMRSGVLLPILHAETGQQRYKTAADKIRNRFPTYPRTPDGGMIHNTGFVDQLWADGVYMAQPFIANYAKQYNQTYGFDESTRNMVAYFNHLRTSNGLILHAYDVDGSSSWATGTDHCSDFHWGRAIGWFAMSAIDILEVLPVGHVRRQAMIDIVRHLAGGFQRFQDAATGRWFQVVDRGTTNGNWTETSASSMFTYMLSRGVERGYLDPSVKPVATKGYQGVLGKISLGGDGRTNLVDICDATSPGTLSYYLNRPRLRNDFHGLGAFLIMNEQLTRVP